MFDILIKYFFIIWCGIYLFSKLTNSQIAVKQKLACITVALFATIISYFFRIYIPPLNLITIYATVFSSSLIVYKKPFSTTVTISVISFCMSFILYAISWLLTLPITYILYSSINKLIVLDTFTAIIIGISQFICTYFLFQIKRFKNGIISLEEELSSDLSVFISVVALFMISLIYMPNTDLFIDTIIIFSIVIIGLLLFIWWKKYTNNVYLKNIHHRNIKILENKLSEQTDTNTELIRQNEELSKIIHRDNKLIPAMEIAVEEILNCQSPDEQKKKAEALLPQLKTMSAERSGIVTEYETINKKLPSTDIFSVDSSLKYLLKKANDKNIKFDLSVTAEISNVTNNIINEDDLNTLILDLGENAIIATSNIEHRNVLVVMGYENQRFCISFYDSGNHFDPKVISKLGVRRITTHNNTGGSGIGMMTTFELLQKYQASFILDETINSDKFTKKIAIHFDTKNEYHIQTNRSEVINIAKKRTDFNR